MQGGKSSAPVPQDCMKGAVRIPGASLVAQTVKNACNAGDQDSIPELGRSPGEGIGNPLQYSCLENSMDREAWQFMGSQSQTRLSD